MPFGFKNATSVYQRAVTKALGELAQTYVVCYVDDIVIVANSFDEALTRLQTVLEVLIESGFSMNIKKCSFLKKRIEYLGYVIEGGQIRPNPKKVEAPPETVTQVS